MLPDWIELCALLSENKVEFLVVGGQAVVAHGYPRMTKDLDLWVRPTRQNGQQVLTALAQFGMTAGNVTSEVFEKPETLLVLGREPFRVDVLTHLPGLDFELAWRQRVSVTLDGVVLPLISKADLIANKKTVGRPQDIADVFELEKLET